jgi:hypothetical protein
MSAVMRSARAEPSGVAAFLSEDSSCIIFPRTLASVLISNAGSLGAPTSMVRPLAREGLGLTKPGGRWARVLRAVDQLVLIV